MKVIKKMLMTASFGFLIVVGHAQNIYTSNGSLTSHRVVTLGNNLSFVPTTSNSQFFINGFSGNVGLGTSTPQSRFHVENGNIRLNTGQFIIGTPFTTWDESTMNWGMKSTRGIVLQQPSTGPHASFSTYYQDVSIELAIPKCAGCYSSNAQVKDAVLRGSSAGSFIISNENTGNIKFETRSVLSEPSKIQMLIDKNGNIGIGTGSNVLNPDEKLAVNGLIHTKEVKVDMVGWPDYVFTNEYILPTLAEVEDFITKNGHLKGIPSAQEVSVEGINLGEMNKLLLEKIEELTLYMIELNKQLEILKNQQINR